MSRLELPEVITSGRVIPVARDQDRRTAPGLASALQNGGIGVIEVTLEGTGGVAAISSLRGSGITIGAGSVTTVTQAVSAIQAGAQFIVSPHLEVELVEWAVDHDVVHVPGGFTPTEVSRAWKLGTPAVKLFPAVLGGPELVKTLLGPYPELRLIPTGGVTADNASAYLAAGAIAVGVGGWLTGHDDLSVVTGRARQLVDSLA